MSPAKRKQAAPAPPGHSVLHRPEDLPGVHDVVGIEDRLDLLLKLNQAGGLLQVGDVVAEALFYHC